MPLRFLGTRSAKFFLDQGDLILFCDLTVGEELILVSMRKQFLLFLLFFLFSQFGLAQNHEVGLMLGGLVSQDRGSAPNNISLSRGTSYQANQCRTQSGSAYTASRSISAADVKFW